MRQWCGCRAGSLAVCVVWPRRGTTRVVSGSCAEREAAAAGPGRLGRRSGWDSGGGSGRGMRRAGMTASRDARPDFASWEADPVLRLRKFRPRRTAPADRAGGLPGLGRRAPPMSRPPIGSGRDGPPPPRSRAGIGSVRAGCAGGQICRRCRPRAHGRPWSAPRCGPSAGTRCGVRHKRFAQVAGRAGGSRSPGSGPPRVAIVHRPGDGPSTQGCRPIIGWSRGRRRAGQGTRQAGGRPGT